MSSIERITIELPKGFDSTKHRAALERLIAEKYGPGFDLDSIDPVALTATASRQPTTTEVSAKSQDVFDVRLASGTKPADGDKVEARLMDQYPGYFMTVFDPFLGRATLARLNEDEARCRGAVAVALGVKPWDVQVKQVKDGGFELGLPRSYMGSKHDEKLHEVAAEVVGQDGWYVRVDAQKLTARIIPAEPPTFPAVIPFPIKRLGRGDVNQTPFGWSLAGPGEPDGQEVVIDWTASGSALVTGLSGGGKSVTTTAILADRLSNGASLAIVDTADKAVDFIPFKDRCAVRSVEGHLIPTWGCNTLEDAVTVLAMLCEEGQARARKLAELGVNNWLGLPEDQRFEPVLIIADEYEALVTRTPEPKALPKDHPIRMEAIEENMAHDLIAHYMNRIVKEFRFVGLQPLISTQVSNATSGLPPSLKGKMGHFVLCGSSPSDAARRQAFPDERSVPRVPHNVASGGAVARGTGAAQIEGGGAHVFKSFYADIEDYQEALGRLDLPRYSDRQVTPTAEQVSQYVPRLDDDEDDDPGPARRGDERAPSGRLASEVAAEMGDEYGVALHDGSLGSTPFERANAARHAAANPGGQTRKQKKEAAEEAEWAAKSGEVTVSQLEESEW